MRKLRGWLENAPSLSPISPPNLFCLSTKNFLLTNQGASLTPHPSQECHCTVRLGVILSSWGQSGSRIHLFPNLATSCWLILVNNICRASSPLLSPMFTLFRRRTKHLSNIEYLDKLCLCQKHCKVKLRYLPSPQRGTYRNKTVFFSSLKTCCYEQGEGREEVRRPWSAPR